MSWVNGSILSGCHNPALYAKHKRLALIKRVYATMLRRQAAAERARIDSAIDELDGALADG